MNLDNRHPVWKRMFRRWQMAYDFWRGGVHIVEPDHEATLVGWYEDVTDPAESSPEPGAQIGKRNWRTSWANSYLWKHERETINEYDYRQTRAINIPLYQYIINTLSAGVLRSKPAREGVEGWVDTHKDMDLLGTDVDAFFRRALSMALVFGRIHAITDRPSFDTPAVSKAEQLVRGERAYGYLVTPIDVVNWAVDDRGRFVWVQIREDAPDTRQPGDEEKKAPDQYRIWYQDRWELWQESTDEERTANGERWIKVTGDVHPVGRVPLSTLYATRTNDAWQLACETPLADALDYNRYLINKHSELDEVDRMQSWSQLAIPTIDGAFGSIDIGPGRYLGYPAEGGAPSYLSPDSSLPKGKAERMDAGIQMQRGLAGIGRGKAEYSKEERSAAALTVESEDKQNQLAWWSKALNEFDDAFHRDLAKWDARSDVPTANYPTNYDVKATMTQIQELVQLAAVPIMGKAMEAQSAAVKPILRKMLGDGGAKEDEIEEVIGTLDAVIKQAEQDKIDEKEAAEKLAKTKAQGMMNAPTTKPFGGNSADPT